MHDWTKGQWSTSFSLHVVQFGESYTQEELQPWPVLMWLLSLLYWTQETWRVKPLFTFSHPHTTNPFVWMLNWQFRRVTELYNCIRFWLRFAPTACLNDFFFIHTRYQDTDNMLKECTKWELICILFLPQETIDKLHPLPSILNQITESLGPEAPRILVSRYILDLYLIWLVSNL